MDAKGNLIDVLANAQGPGQDVSYFPTPGTYLLDINSFGGAWDLKVILAN